jgi:His/Glu/Gln/Arg/opine family amino acid ABC transporter permease subunit
MEATNQPQVERQPLWYRVIYDKETRSVAIQVLTLALLFAFFFYIVRNAIINLETIGKGYSFKFLWDASNYDINQHLIEYDSRSPHWRATIVGIMNTLLVAVTGVIIATIVGFFLGVLRLSPNWLINKVVYVYIEYVRNVPVLLHILMVHGIIVNTLPRPKDAISMIEGTFFLTNRGFYAPKPLFEPAMWAVLIAFVVGIGFSIWFKHYAKKVQDATGKIYPVLWISLGAIIVFPILVYFVVGSPMSFEMAELKGFNFKGGMVLRPEYLALTLALALYSRHSGDQPRADRGRASAWCQGKPDHELDCHPAGPARDNTAAVEPVPEPDQEFVAGDRDRLHGYRRHDRRYLVEPDRARDGVYDDRAGLIPVILVDDLGVYELV